MKILVDEKQEGLTGLIGKEVTFFCLNYIYAGKLVGINKTCIKLENAKVIYETGDFTDKQWKDAQPLPENWYLRLNTIESFGVLK